MSHPLKVTHWEGTVDDVSSLLVCFYSSIKKNNNGMLNYQMITDFKKMSWKKIDLQF